MTTNSFQIIKKTFQNLKVIILRLILKFSVTVILMDVEKELNVLSYLAQLQHKH